MDDSVRRGAEEDLSKPCSNAVTKAGQRQTGTQGALTAGLDALVHNHENDLGSEVMGAGRVRDASPWHA